MPHNFDEYILLVEYMNDSQGHDIQEDHPQKNQKK